MNKMTWAATFALFALAGSAERATVELCVLDADSGAPLPGVGVRGSFATDNGAAAWKGSARPTVVNAVTDSNGCCRVRGETNCGRASVWVSEPPAGYYAGGMRVSYATTGEKARGHWLPEVVRQTIRLQKIGSGVPLAVRQAELFLKPQERPESVSYDLFEGDWLPPHGEGKVADLVFRSVRETTGVETRDPRDPKKARLEFYTWRHTLSVPGKGNGLCALHPDPQLTVRLRAGTDEGLVPAVTREVGLRKQIEEDGWYPVSFGGKDPTVAYALRVRSAFDAAGRRTKAWYAKIERDFEVTVRKDGAVGSIAFAYALNPVANDRNLEWDCEHNLDPATVREAKRRECVDVSVPAHDPVTAADLVQQAIDARSREGGGKVCLGPGEIELAPLVLKDGVTLFLKENTTLLASTNAAHYAAHHAFLYAEDARDAGVVGKGVIDGRGWAFKAGEGLSGESSSADAPTLGRFVRCRRLRLTDFTFRNAAARGLHLFSCDGVVVRRVTAFCHANGLNDGLVIASRAVEVTGCVFDTAGDALAVKSESSFETGSVDVRFCTFRSCGDVLRLGAADGGRCHDIRIGDCKVERSGARTGRFALALEAAGGGRLEKVKISNIDIRSGVQTPVSIAMVRRLPPKPGQESALRNVYIGNVKGCAEGRLACSIAGLPDARPSDITLANVELTFPGGGTASEAAAWGFDVRHADNVRFRNVKLKLSAPDARSRLVTEDAKNFTEQ